MMWTGRTTYPGRCAHWVLKYSQWQDRNSGSCQGCCDSDRSKYALQWEGHTRLCLRKCVNILSFNDYCNAKAVYLWVTCTCTSKIAGNWQVGSRYYSSNCLTFTSHAIYVAQLVTTATVAVVGAVHIGTLLTAWVAVTLIQICTDKRWLRCLMKQCWKFWNFYLRIIHGVRFSHYIGPQTTNYSHVL